MASHVKMKDYSDDGAGRSFNNLNDKVECKYIDPTDDSYKTTNIESIMSKYIHERAIIFGGAKHSGKTVFAAAAAMDGSLMCSSGVNTPVQSHSFVFTDGIQSWSKADLQTDRPLVTDDSEVVQAAFWDASISDYLKGIFNPQWSGSVRVLGKFVDVPKCMRLFTTNSTSLDEFVKGGSSSLSQEHFEAIARRVVFVRVKAPLFTAAALQAHRDEQQIVYDERTTRLEEFSNAGLW
jgi:hypothetical protein